MATHGNHEITDRQIGLPVLFGLIAGLGALVMFLFPEAQLAGWGFAIAMVAAMCAVIFTQI